MTDGRREGGRGGAEADRAGAKGVGRNSDAGGQRRKREEAGRKGRVGRRGDLTCVGWLRRRGFPNCAVSLSVIDRFAGTINTRRTRLSLPPRRTPSPFRSRPCAVLRPRPTNPPPTYVLLANPSPVPRPSSGLRLNHPTTVYRAALAVSLRRYFPSSSRHRSSPRPARDGKP